MPVAREGASTYRPDAAKPGCDRGGEKKKDDDDEDEDDNYLRGKQDRLRLVAVAGHV